MLLECRLDLVSDFVNAAFRVVVQIWVSASQTTVRYAISSIHTSNPHALQGEFGWTPWMVFERKCLALSPRCKSFLFQRFVCAAITNYFPDQCCAPQILPLE